MGGERANNDTPRTYNRWRLDELPDIVGSEVGSNTDEGRALLEAIAHIEELQAEMAAAHDRAEDEFEIRCAVEDEVEALKSEIRELQAEIKRAERKRDRAEALRAERDHLNHDYLVGEDKLQAAERVVEGVRRSLSMMPHRLKDDLAAYDKEQAHDSDDLSTKATKDSVSLSDALTRDYLRIDFKCGCFTVLWAVEGKVQGGTSCCRAHDRLGPSYHGMEGKTVYDVQPGTREAAISQLTKGELLVATADLLDQLAILSKREGGTE